MKIMMMIMIMFLVFDNNLWAASLNPPHPTPPLDALSIKRYPLAQC